MLLQQGQALFHVQRGGVRVSAVINAAFDLLRGEQLLNLGDYANVIQHFVGHDQRLTQSLLFQGFCRLVQTAGANHVDGRDKES